MRIHRAGYKIILAAFYILLLIDVSLCYFIEPFDVLIILPISILIFIMIVYFYRSPNRCYTEHEINTVLASADGKIVAIEETYEGEYFKDKRILVAIFMSPLNVHINWFPINGRILFSKHHSGRFQAAYLPKSSVENERSTVVIKTECGNSEILLRQIAGAMARRIVTYAKEGDRALVNKHLGFIKFGSRVDIYLPLNSKILVHMNQKVKGNKTHIANLTIK